MMWFKFKPRNRRLGRGHVLDVKLRASKVRAARLRVAAVGLGTCFTLVLGTYLLWCAGALILDSFVYENKAFAIQRIEVQTDGAISEDQIRRWTGVKLNQNLLALDLGRVRRDLELVSRVQSASVERVLPATLLIRVTEREPVAQLNVPRPKRDGGIDFRTCHMDPDGVVMLPLELHQRSVPPTGADALLPLVTGVDYNQVQPGRAIQNTQLKAALRLVLAFERSPMAGLVELKRIDVATPDSLIAYTSQGSEITFGLNDLERQLRRWREVFDLGQKQGKAIASLDLGIENNLPLRLVEASQLPSAPTNPVRTKPNRKKHV